MDLLYMTDAMAYQSVRSQLYESQQGWEQQPNEQQNKVQNKQKKIKEREPCKICQERQRRRLMNYFRSKSHDHSEQNIKEEEEEEEPKSEPVKPKAETAH